MKASLAVLAGALLIASSPWASAASSVDLSVKGAITPSACTPSLSNDGLVDYGKISVQELSEQVTPLPPSTFKLAVNCEGASLFALATLDNRDAPSGGSASFILGRISPTKWVGTYYLTLQNIVTDDPQAYSIYSVDNGSTWRNNPLMTVPSYALIAFGNQLSGVPAPVPIKDASMDLMVEPYIFPKEQIPVGETIELDGFATFELRYL